MAKRTDLVFILLCAACALLVAVAATLLVPVPTPARAAETLSFAYDGEFHTYAYDGPVEGPYLWIRAGETDPVSETETLTVKHPWQSGAYTLCSLRSGEREVVLSLSVSIEKRTLTPIWCVRRSPLSPAYVSNTRYLYNGQQQGVFPYPETYVTGDDIAFETVGNTATDAGAHTARIIGLTGENAEDYALKEGAEYFSFRIEKIPLLVTVEDAEIAFGDEPTDFTAAFSGLVSRDEPDDLGGAFVTPYSTGDDVGAYPLSYSLTSVNYDVTVLGATLTVTPRVLHVAFEDGEGVYGNEPTLAYTFTDARVFDVTPVPYLDDPHVGARTVVGAYAGDNFTVEANAATYVVKPRPLTAEITCAPVYYGERPTFEVTVTSGSYAPGEDESALRISYPDAPKNAGRYTLYPTCGSKDYAATISPCTVEVKPLPVALLPTNVVARYGDPFLTPSLKTMPALPYGETTDHLALTLHKDPGWTCGTYALTYTSDAVNYVVTAESATYTILPRVLNVSVRLPAVGAVLKTGETLTLLYTADGPVGDDDVTVSLRYHKIAENGLEDPNGADAITEAGSYVARAVLSPGEASGNYAAAFLDTDAAVSRVFTLYGDTMTDQGVSVRLSDGYPFFTSVRVVKQDETAFAAQYEKPTDVQSVVCAFSLEFNDLTSQRMFVSVPVLHDNRHYTAAIVKEDGSVVYAPCEVRDGVATFETEAASRTYFLWEDRDSTPYQYACAFLLFALVIELIVFGVLYGKYKAKRGGYYAAAGLPAAMGGGGLFYFIGGTIVLGIADVAFLVAILVVAAKLSKKNRSGGKFIRM